MSSARTGVTRCGGREFFWGRCTYIMGVLNLTPDSFAGDGLGYDVEAAVAQAHRFVEEGAHILDLGGESTRPGHTPISVEEELRRVLPVLERLVKQLPVPLSIDTYKGEVARRALEAGASMLNDIWGLKADPSLATLAARAGVPIVLMHNQKGTAYKDLVAEVKASLKESVDKALAAGVPGENIIIDPGFGFGKILEQNLELLRRLGELRELGRPILVGTSRKSMIGWALALPPAERREGTAATVALAIAQGADMVRVHDVKEMVRVARMADAVVRGRHTCYLGLGSNLGDREENLRRALALLGQRLEVDAISSVYETEPWGYKEQPLFLNQVCRIATRLSPEALLALVKDIEATLGRQPSFPNAPRIIDIDILFYSDWALESPSLTIPHPRLHERAFVLVPLAELAPELVHPLTGRKVRELTAEVNRQGVSRWR